MALEYFKPMLDVGSPRVLNVNVITHRILAKDPAAALFFRNKPLNNLVLIKDTMPADLRRLVSTAIGTKLYFPFNENNIYEGGRTIFASDKHLEAALLEQFGQGAMDRAALDQDLRVIKVLDRLPSLDPFLLKDVFLNEKIAMNEAYFEVGDEVWKEIEQFILERFQPLVKAAFPEAATADEKGRRLVEKLWEARDLEALDPLITAFRLPKSEALEIFSAWKGIIFYSFQCERAKPMFAKLLTWLKDLQFPVVAISAEERKELKGGLAQAQEQLRIEWQKADAILKEYQDCYDKMFKAKTSSAEFVAFLKKSNKLYWELGNSLGKIGHGTYCWDAMSKRFPERKMGWEQLKELIKLLAKIYVPEKPSTAVAW
jgi:hypothetical protein